MPGDRFVAFNGSGTLWKSEIIAVHRNAVEARVVDTMITPPPTLRLTVAVATVKATRMDWAVEKAAELGAVRFIPLETRYSVVEPGQGKVKRWRTIALSAAKQTRQSRLMEVVDPLPLSKYISEIPNDAANPTLLLLDEKERTVTLLEVWSDRQGATSAILFIGPEGGWSEEERVGLRNIGAIPVSIGSNIMRTETAVVVGLGLLMQAGKDR